MLQDVQNLMSEIMNPMKTLRTPTVTIQAVNITKTRAHTASKQNFYDFTNMQRRIVTQTITARLQRSC